jgi:hypothetical protein
MRRFGIGRQTTMSVRVVGANCEYNIILRDGYRDLEILASGNSQFPKQGSFSRRRRRSSPLPLFAILPQPVARPRRPFCTAAISRCNTPARYSQFSDLARLSDAMSAFQGEKSASGGQNSLVTLFPMAPGGRQKKLPHCHLGHPITSCPSFLLATTLDAARKRI